MSNTQIIEPKPCVGETEKMTINRGVVDLGQIDLLVQEGFYSNRSDLVRTAIRNQVAMHADVLRQTDFVDPVSPRFSPFHPFSPLFTPFHPFSPLFTPWKPPQKTNPMKQTFASKVRSLDIASVTATIKNALASGQFGPSAGFGVGDEAGRMLLHQTVQRCVLRAVAAAKDNTVVLLSRLAIRIPLVIFGSDVPMKHAGNRRR